MKVAGAGAAIGAVLGAIVAVVSHFLSETLPSTYEVVGYENGSTGMQTLASPTVHPSWLPVLPVAIAVGVVAGLALVAAAAALGFRLERRRG